MESDDDIIPASPQAKPAAKRRRHRSQIVIKTKQQKSTLQKQISDTNLADRSLQSESLRTAESGKTNDVPEGQQDSVVESNAPSDVIAGPSTSGSENRTRKKVDFYSLISDNEDYSTAPLSNNIDIHINAKLLEEADKVPYIRKRSGNASNIFPSASNKFVAFSQLFGRENQANPVHRSVLAKFEGEVTSNEETTDTNERPHEVVEGISELNKVTKPSGCPPPSARLASLRFETQFFDETESQILAASNIADAAQCLIDGKFSDWKSPDRRTPIPDAQESPNIVERILNDFDFESPPNSVRGNPSTSKPDDAIISSPSLVLRRDSQRTYSRLRPKAQSKSAKKLRFDLLESDSGSGSDNEEKTSSSLNETIFEMDNNIALDLNSSRNIIENIVSLTSFFTQPQSFDEPLDNLVTFDDCDISVVNVDTDDSITPADEGLFGVINENEDSRLFCDLSVVEEAVTTVPVRIHEPCEKSLLDEDEDLLMDLPLPSTQTALNYRRNTEMASENMPSTSRSTRSEPSLAATIVALEPEAPRFNRPQTSTSGFSTARDISVPHSRNTALLFADIDKDLPLIDAPSTSLEYHMQSTTLKPYSLGAIGDNLQFGGFQTGRGNKIKISEQALQRSNAIYEEVGQEPMVAMQPDVNVTKRAGKVVVESNKLLSGFTTGQNNAMATRNPQSCGFQTGRGNAIKISDEALQRSNAAYNEVRQLITTVDQLETSRLDFSTGNRDSKENVASKTIMNGFTTSRGAVITIPSKATKRSAGFFEDIENELAQEEMHTNKNPGFISARGNCSHVPSKRFKDAANLFADIFDELPISGEPSPFSRGNPLPSTSTGFKSATLKATLEENPVLQVTKSYVLGAINDNPQLGGFKTGRGLTIKVSDEALQRSNAAYNQVRQEITTAKQLEATALDLKTARRDNKENVASKIISNEFTTSRGFSSSNAIYTSEQATATTADLKIQPNTDDDDLARGTRIESPTPDFNGFSAGRGSSIQESADALHQLKAILQNTDASNEPLKTPTNLRFRHGLSTSTPNTLYTTPGTSALTPNTIDKLKSAEDSLNFLKQFDRIDDLFDVDGDFERRLLKQTCLASKFDAALEDETITETSVAELSISPEVQSCPFIIPENVKIGRRLALQQQANLENRKSDQIRPVPGSLLLEKMLSSKQKLIDLGVLKPTGAAELKSLGVSESTINFTSSNFESFEFKMWEYYSLDICQTNIHGIHLKDDITLIMNENATVGLTEIKSAFLQCPSVDPKLIPEHWLGNSLKWILWKLASIAWKFPHQYSTTSLTPENVLLQLKYRYDREIDRAERSALQRIVERDDVAARRMVLFVSNIKKYSNVEEYSLELCDGWYSIGVQADAVLQYAIQSGKIQIGTKLFVQGAELIGAEEACSPLENNNSVQLKISANSTRRAAWHTKLGYYKNMWPFIVSLDAIHANGGLISRLAVFILRVYPIMYMVKLDDGKVKKTVLRSEKVERRHTRIEERERFELVEKLYSQVRNEVEIEFEERRKTIEPPKTKIAEIADAEELWKLMERSHDPTAVEMQLSSTQKQMVSSYRTRLYDEKLAEINDRVREKLNADNNNESKVSSVLRIRVIDARHPTNKVANISIWNPSENYSTVLREGQFLEVQNAIGNGLRWSELQLTTGPRTTYRNVTYPLLSEHIEMARKFTSIATIDPKVFQPTFNEFDTIGFVVFINEEPIHRFQPAYIADAKGNLLCINFWLSIKDYAYDDTVKIGQFIAISHLEWRPSNQLKHSTIPQAYATEYTMITDNPKSVNLKPSFEAMQNDFKAISDKDGFIDECLQALESAKINNVALRSNTTTPLRSSSFGIVTTLSPLAGTSSGGSRSKSELSPAISIVRQKLETLGNYVQPPPISPIILKATGKRRSFRGAFKSPMNTAFYKDLEVKRKKL